MTTTTPSNKEYNKQRISQEYGETIVQLMLCLGWEIISEEEYECESTSATRVYFNLYYDERSDGYYDIYFSRDKQIPYYEQLVNYQREIFELGQKEAPEKPEKYEIGLILLGILFPILGVGLIIATIVSKSRYAKKKKKYDEDNARAHELIAQASDLLEKSVNERGETLDDYLQRQAENVKRALE